MHARRIGKARTVAALALFASEPLSAMRRLHRDFGPFIVAELPHSTRERPKRIFLVADAQLYREMLTNTEVWRNTQINARGRNDHASNRLSQGMTRLRGERHEHYRRLLAPPLKRAAVAAISPKMADIAGRQVDSWPVDRPVPLIDAVKAMAQHLQGNRVK